MLLPTTLRDGLMQIANSNSEAEAIEAWVQAIVNYFGTATAGVVPITQPILSGAPAAAARVALQGLSTTGGAAVQAAFFSFWGTMALTPALYFVGATALTPPPALANLAVTLNAVFAANTAANLPEPDAKLAIAIAIHASNAGGAANISGVNTPIT